MQTSIFESFLLDMASRQERLEKRCAVERIVLVQNGSVWDMPVQSSG